jgi:RibD C-terminal domain
VRTLKAEPGKNIISDGSSQLLQTLLKADLVDELHLLLYPVTLGGGKRLLPEGSHLTFADGHELVPDRRRRAPLRAQPLTAAAGSVSTSEVSDARPEVSSSDSRAHRGGPCRGPSAICFGHQVPRLRWS